MWLILKVMWLNLLYTHCIQWSDFLITFIWIGRIQVYLSTNRQNTNMLKEVYLNTKRETTILLYILEGGEYGDRQALMAGGAGPSFAVCGAGPLSSLVGGAGPLLSTAGGVAGPSSFFVGGMAGCWSHCSWVVVVCPHHTICEWWWWCALVSFHAAWPPSLSWWSCHRSRERVVGRSCLQTLHPSSSNVGILHRFHVLLSRILIVMCRPFCDVSFDCHVTVSDMAPVVKRWLGGGRWAYSPRLIVAHVCTWLLAIIHEPWFICGRPSSFVGGRLRFWAVMVAVGLLVVIGIRGRSWRSVVVKSMVGSGDWWQAWLVVVRWWWWEEKSWLCLVSKMPNKHCLFGPHMWDHHMYDLTWWSQTHPMEIHQTVHRFQFFFHRMGSDSVRNYKT